MLLAALLAVLSSGVDVQARPAALRLDHGTRAELTFRAPSGPLTVQCSAGSLDGLRETAPGLWHAVWRAPKSLAPQVAIIVARSGDAVGFASLPLWGGGDAEVRTRPGAVVSVNIGPETFGPLRAGADGVALVPVVVPPGVDFAQQGERLIDLHIPRTRTVQLGPVPAEVAVDRDREVEIAVAAVTRAGAPLIDAELQLAASRGVFGALAPLGPGLYFVRWRIPAGPPGEAVLAATVAGDPSPSEVAVRLVAGEPATIELQSPQAAAPGVPVELTASVKDAAGNDTGDPVEFSASAGTLATGSTAPGGYRVVLTPPVVAESEELTVTAATRRGPAGPTASARVLVVPQAEAEAGTRRSWSRATIGIRTGYLGNGHGLDAPLFGLEGALRRRWRTLQAALVVDLWWARAQQTTTMSSASIDARDDFFVGSIGGSLRLPLSDRTTVWAQAAAALVGASARVVVSGPTQGEGTSRGAVPGLEIGLGAERRMWGGVPFLDVRLLRTASFALPNLLGALTAFTISAGYRLEMP